MRIPKGGIGMKKVKYLRRLGVIVCLLGVVLPPVVHASGFADWLKKDREERSRFEKGGKSAPERGADRQQAGTSRVPVDAPVPHDVADGAVDGPAGGNGWLIMVYMAGDNNLDPFAMKDIEEMQKTGSSRHLKIVVLLDRVDYGKWSTSRRFLVRRPEEQGGLNSWSTSLSTCEDLGELNMGDPATLTSFVKWASSKYPQPNKMLILWNHGGGWRSVVSRAVSKGAASRGGGAPGAGLSRLSRGIAWDDTNGGDFLEMREVRGALEPFKKLSVIGADACLMGMLEVAYELRERCWYFIGSEDIEPGDGWPYDRWLPRLADNTAMPAEELCRVIVEAYSDSYGNKPTTLSAVRQNSIASLAKSVDALACALIDHSESGTEPKISFKGLPWFSPGSPEFVDLGAFLKRLQKGYPGSVKKAAGAAMDALERAVLINRSHKKLGGTGLSIYPGGGYNDRDYRAGIIQFARDTRWDELLRELSYKAKEAQRSKIAGGTPDRWAVLIGVEDYTDDSINSLNYSVDDIEKLRDTLVKYAGYKEDHIKMLKDKEATAANVRSTLGTWLPRQVSDDDMVLIYFSGHGGAEPSIRGDSKDGTEKYMLLSDSRASDMYGTAIPMSELSRIFGRIRADRLLFAMDSCYSGATGKGVLSDGMKAAGLTDDYLNAMSGSSGTVVLTASRPNEVSMESEKYTMGLFSHFLCEALSGKSDSDKDGLVSVVELFQYLNSKVPDAARKMGASQHPVMKGEISGTFPIAAVSVKDEEK
jgi:hypothetical protein